MHIAMTWFTTALHLGRCFKAGVQICIFFFSVSELSFKYRQVLQPVCLFFS